MLKKMSLWVAGVFASLLVMVAPAQAALDVAVTTAITTAETDLVALYTALMSAGVVIWIARVIYNKFRVR